VNLGEVARQAGLIGAGDLVLESLQAKTPAKAGVSQYQGRNQAGIFASSSDGSRST
jgi:hypothetical protein